MKKHVILTLEKVLQLPEHHNRLTIKKINNYISVAALCTCSGRVIEAHNSVLCVCSSVFNAFCPYMRNDMGQCTEMRVCIYT